jgi:hypothetical protein
VSEWQVWPVLGLPHFRGTGREYLALLQAAAARLRATSASARVVMASPVGMDLAFLVNMAKEAPGAFDAVDLAPFGYMPEALLRPLAVLSRTVKSAGKSIWIDWAPEAQAAANVPPMPGPAGSMPAPAAATPASLWPRMFVIAQASGVERLFVAEPVRLDGSLPQIAAAVRSPLMGWLVREPDVYAAVFGPSSEPAIVAWAPVEGRTFDVTALAGARIATTDGQAVLVEPRNERQVITLRPLPMVIANIPQALAEEARASLASRGPMLPVVGSDRDFSRSPDVSARFGRAGQERGLYNSVYRSRRNGAVDVIEVGGAEAIQTSISRQVVYVYFDVDDTFAYFVEGRVPVEITIEVYGARTTEQVGYNILYDSVSGYRFTPWQWVEAKNGWQIYTTRLTDASMANTWGWDFAINTAGNRVDDLIVRSVTVRKAVQGSP